MPAYITVSRKDIAESGALRKVLLCRLRNGDTREVVRLRIPDSGEYHIFADTPKLARC